jgi:hypothetical protein
VSISHKPKTWMKLAKIIRKIFGFDAENESSENLARGCRGRRDAAAHGLQVGGVCAAWHVACYACRCAGANAGVEAGARKHWSSALVQQTDALAFNDNCTGNALWWMRQV